MDSNPGGQPNLELQRETAAEIARKKVLAAYSSTVEHLKNLPPSAREHLINHETPHNSQSTYNSNANPAPTSTPGYQNLQPDWTHDANQTSTYQRTPIYSPDSSSSATSDTTYSSSQSGNFGSPSYSDSSYPQSNPTYPNPANAYSTNPADTYINTANSYSDPSSAYANPDTAYSELPSYSPANPSSTDTDMLKDAPINQSSVDDSWREYHSAWQNYYKDYYSQYYAKAAESYLATEKMKNERIAVGAAQRKRNHRRLIPVIIVILIILTGLFLQYNRLIFAPIMAYVSPDSGSVATSIEPVDPMVSQAVSPEPRLIIPKLNIDVPVAFGIATSSVDDAMNQGVAQFSIPGANAIPGQIGNLVITGHSAGDIYSSNPYKFIFSGLERLENGDLIYVNYNSVRYTYQMVGRETVEPSNVSALIYPTDKPMLTLITCTPLGTSRYRLLVSAEQISPSYSGADSSSPSDDASSSNPSADSSSQPSDNQNVMPANEPSFFENLWQGIFGH